MAAPRFFVDLSLAPSAVGSEVALPDDAAHHALRVRRLGAGDVLTLFNGEGGEYAATITHAGKRDARVRIDGFAAGIGEPALAVTLVQALVATDPMDAIVRHATELGVARVQPLVTARSARFPAGAHGDRRVAHWRAIALAACEQCGRNRVPDIAIPLDFDAWLEARHATRAGFMLVPEGDRGLGDHAQPEAELDVLIGPEGGFTSAETDLAGRRGIAGVRLGPRILRAETAALAALAAVNVLWSDGR